MRIEAFAQLVRRQRAKRKDLDDRLAGVRFCNKRGKFTVPLVRNLRELREREAPLGFKKGGRGNGDPAEGEPFAKPKERGAGGNSLTHCRIAEDPLVVEVQVFQNLQRGPAVGTRSVDLLLQWHCHHLPVDFAALGLKALEVRMLHGGLYETADHIGKPVGASVGLSIRLSIVRARKSHDLIVPTGRP